MGSGKRHLINVAEMVLLDRSGLTRAAMRSALHRIQGGHCAVCPSEGPLVGDHDHDTGLLRGLLCRSCNGREGRMRTGFPFYADLEVYLASPPAAGLGWMWDYPDWWCAYDQHEAARLGMTVFGYVAANPGLGRRREELAQERARAMLASIELPPLSAVPPATVLEPEPVTAEPPAPEPPKRRRRRAPPVTIEEAIAALQAVNLPPLDA